MTGRPGQRRDGDLPAQLVDADLAGQPVAAVDEHRVGAAHAVGARAAERERAVLLVLDRVEQVEDAVLRVGLDGVALPVRLLVALGVVAEDAQVDLHRRRLRSVDPRLRLERGDRHRLVGQRRARHRHAWRGCGLRKLTSSRSGIVLAAVGAAALLAREGRGDRRLGAVEQVAELARLEQVRVEDRTLVVRRATFRVAVAQLADPGCARRRPASSR